MSHYKGTLYFCISKNDNRVVLLSAAHIARPPPADDKMATIGNLADCVTDSQ
jgi:hypothetical protein